MVWHCKHKKHSYIFLYIVNGTLKNKFVRSYMYLVKKYNTGIAALAGGNKINLRCNWSTAQELFCY